MTIEVQRVGGSIQAAYKTSLGQPVTVDLGAYATLGEAGLKLVELQCDFVRRLSKRSAVNYLRAVSDIGKALTRTGITRLPTDEAGWQALVLTLHSQIITNPDSNATLRTRVTETLPTVNRLLGHLQASGMLPLSVLLPECRSNFEHLVESSAAGHFLCDEPPQVVARFPTKVLCDISLSRTDGEYLDYVRDELSRRRIALRAGVIEYWTALKTHVEYGREATASIDAEALLKRLQTKGVSERDDGKFGKGVSHYCAPDSATGLPRFLVLIRETIGAVPTTEQLRRSPFLPRFLSNENHRLYLPPGVSMLAVQDDTRMILPMRLRWFLGRLNAQDIAVLSALIIMDHPKFTPEAITQSRLFDSNGKQRVEFGDLGISFTVEKHRAHKVKTAILSELTLDIITLVASLAPDIRAQLRKNNSPLSEALFIQFDHLGTNPKPPQHTSIVTFLSGKGCKKAWLATFVPSLFESGFVRGSITFKKIRATQGVLEWFRTGSTTAMARVLGNKVRTAIDHYLPRPLILAWNTRLLRRFQNLWLCVAAADEDYLPGVTDFSNRDDLHNFLVSMLEQHTSGSSPLAMELHRRFATHPGSDGNAGLEASRSDLAVSIGKTSLAALYLYQDAVLSAGANDNELDEAGAAGVCPRAFLDLAALLQRQLPAHQDRAFQRVHVEASDVVEKLSGRITWTPLIRKRNAA